MVRTGRDGLRNARPRVGPPHTTALGSMDIAVVLVVLAVGVTLGVLMDTFWVAVFRTTPQGRFKVSIDNVSSFSFLTKLGAFSVDRGKRMLSFVIPGQKKGLLPLSHIKGLEYRAQVKSATLQELFFGLDLTDLLPRYRDTIDWYSISAVTTDEERIPIYLGGQYQPREFLLTWYIDLQAALLERLGLVHDEGEESRAALNVIQRQLGNVQLV